MQTWGIGMGLSILHNIAANAIHSTFHVPLNLVPVSAAFRKLNHLLHTPDTMEPIRVRDEVRQFLGVGGINQVYLYEFTECRKVKKEFVVSEGLDIFEVVVHIADFVSMASKWRS